MAHIEQRIEDLEEKVARLERERDNRTVDEIGDNYYRDALEESEEKVRKLKLELDSYKCGYQNLFDDLENVVKHKKVPHFQDITKNIVAYVNGLNERQRGLLLSHLVFKVIQDDAETAEGLINKVIVNHFTLNNKETVPCLLVPKHKTVIGGKKLSKIEAAAKMRQGEGNGYED
jgi:hypothetical protein